eukprot:Clim_evm2s75 gene=Clim_evmTU2s75
MQRWTTALLRRHFVDYFANHAAVKHRPTPGASVVPQAGDRSLLFVNAGMVQFRNVFSGNEEPKVPAATSIQRCIRAGGKHNDLSQVGYTARHHTMFEMLGTFGFRNAYSKDQTIAMAWDYLTGPGPARLALPQHQLVVSVHREDKESYDIWHRSVGIPPARILRLGDEDNFWSAGDGPGPCGHSTEIFWWHKAPDYPTAGSTTAATSTDHPTPREEDLLEIWNLVFMNKQRRKAPDGSLVVENAPPELGMQVDTGMGLERLASVLQGARPEEGSWASDGFRELEAGIATALGLSYVDGRLLSAAGTGGSMSAAAVPLLRITADHLRTVSALVAEGLSVGPTGRDYVVRRLARRLIAAVHNLEGLYVGSAADESLPARSPRPQLLLPRLCDVLTETLTAQDAEHWQDIIASADGLKSMLTAEEQGFLDLLRKGTEHLMSAIEKTGGTVSADELFTLHDSHGLPLEVAEMLLTTRGLTYDAPGVEALMALQRQRSRDDQAAGGGVTGAGALNATHGAASGPFFDTGSAQVVEIESMALAIGSGGVGSFVNDAVDATAAATVEAEVRGVRRDVRDASMLWLALNPCPFYAEGGGQIADHGSVAVLGGSADSDSPLCATVCDVQMVDGHTPAVCVQLPDRSASGDTSNPVSLSVGTKVRCVVDHERRNDLAVHHTATHVLGAALRNVLLRPQMSAGSGAEGSEPGRQEARSPGKPTKNNGRGKSARALQSPVQVSSITQAGSLVEPHRLRFDFFFPRALTSTELAAIEDFMNDVGRRGGSLAVMEMDLQEAVHEHGAVAHFQDKGVYESKGKASGNSDSHVRVVEIPGVSIELCGGCHVPDVSRIWPVVLASETSCGKGKRRIEAHAGDAAVRYLRHSRQAAVDATRALGGKVPNLPALSSASSADGDWLRGEALTSALALATSMATKRGQDATDRAKTLKTLLVRAVTPTEPTATTTLVGQTAALFVLGGSSDPEGLRNVLQALGPNVVLKDAYGLLQTHCRASGTELPPLLLLSVDRHIACYVSKPTKNLTAVTALNALLAELDVASKGSPQMAMAMLPEEPVNFEALLSQGRATTGGK